MAEIPKAVTVVEVAPRDGLQSETVMLETEDKIAFIDRLSQTGLPTIEVAAFVSPERVPQLADAEAVCSRIQRRPGVRYPALVPNAHGLERAMRALVSDIAIFTAASETFCWKNLNRSIEASLQGYRSVIATALGEGIRVRAYISCVMGCPYEGEVPVDEVVRVAGRLFRMGCDEITLGDTIGIGTPLQARELVEAVAQVVPVDRLALHFHDTRGQALANVLACLELGVATVDASVAGLGGCPFAPGAAGNLATEDLVYMLHGMGVETGVDLDRLLETGTWISEHLGHDSFSRLSKAG